MSKKRRVKVEREPSQPVKNPVLRDIIREIEKEKKDRVAFPYWGNWLNWLNWRNWGNWYNGW